MRSAGSSGCLLPLLIDEGAITTVQLSKDGMPEDLDGVFSLQANEPAYKASITWKPRKVSNGDIKVKKDGSLRIRHSSAPACDADDDSDDEFFPGEDSLEKLNSDAHRESANGSSGSSSAGRSRTSPVRTKAPKKKVSRFYQRQLDLVENFKKDDHIIEEAQRRRMQALSLSSEKDAELGKLLIVEPLEEDVITDRNSSVDLTVKEAIPLKQDAGMSAAARWLAMATLIVNISLVIAKAAASYLSGSLSIISSLVDSAVDITSGLVIWLTARAIKKHDPYMYPRGRTRLEPIALIIVSVIMGVASVQMTVQSLESVVRRTVNPHMDIASLCIMLTTVFVKFTLMILCKKFDSDASITVLAQDHRNDCISNLVALFCACAAAKYWIYLDPIGAIIVSIYIAITWYFTGKEHLTMLSGKSAKPDFINRIVKVCVEHDRRIDYIDTVYVYHFGTRYLVEVHVVMDKDMTLQTSHDITEALQNNIESLPEVERAFVHCDYEFSHMPSHEHKVV